MSKKPQIEKSAWLYRISALLDENEVSIADFARKAGISKNLLYAYLAGSRKPASDNLLAIADAAGVSLDWLAGRPGAARKYGSKDTLRSVQAGISEATGLVPVPTCESAGASGKLVETSGEKAWLWIANFWVERYGKANLAVIRHAGDSMLPTIEPGSLVMLNTADRSTNSGLKAVQIGDGLTVKRCDPRPRKALRMVSDNPAYEPFTAKSGECQIVGAVVATIRLWE